MVCKINYLLGQEGRKQTEILISVCICTKNSERMDKKPRDIVVARGALSVWWGVGG